MQRALLQQTDEELLLRYRKTLDKELVGELFKRHSLMCFTVCMKYLKHEDAAQDATMSIFEQLFGDLNKHEIGNFRNWLHSVCRNYCLMQLRKPGREVSLFNDNEEKENGTFFMQLEQLMHPESNAAEKEEKLVALEEAVAGLKHEQRECITLFYFRQKSYEEIAQLTGSTTNEVKSHVQNGRRNLRLALNEKGITLGILLYAWI